jgi:hypothetical protein
MLNVKYSCNFDLFRYVLPASAQRDQHLLQPHPVQEPLRPPAHRTAGRPASPACPATPATAVWVCTFICPMCRELAYGKVS